jgi:hypothetical protein
MPNIDEGDEDNPQLVTEYVNDIYDYLRFLEVSFFFFSYIFLIDNYCVLFLEKAMHQGKVFGWQRSNRPNAQHSDRLAESSAHPIPFVAGDVVYDRRLDRSLFTGKLLIFLSSKIVTNFLFFFRKLAFRRKNFNWLALRRCSSRANTKKCTPRKSAISFILRTIRAANRIFAPWSVYCCARWDSIWGVHWRFIFCDVTAKRLR